MAEFSVQFTNKLNGYDKAEVDQFVLDAEAKLQEKAVAIAALEEQVAELEARLERVTGADASVEEKVAQYDKLMRKMDGDYKNLLAPAIAKAKAIEEKAEKEYQVRIDQARYAADGIYKEATDRITHVVDSNMVRVYGLIGEYMHSKTLLGRVESLIGGCKTASKKVATTASNAAKASSDVCRKVCKTAKEKYKDVVTNVQLRLSRPSAVDADFYEISVEPEVEETL
ncbi:MAG: DivIVA domain-containing protein [Clostridia bacterium]|nr:DivIVA domain-containing protein [Clostridia bacterium]